MSNLFGAKVFPKQPLKYHNCNSPKKKWTTNIILSWTTSKISHLKCSVNSCEQPGWYHVHYEQPAQRMSNQHVYYSLWATNYFSLKFFSKSKMCQRGPGDAGRILPLVSYLLSYLFRYPLGTNVVPFGTSFKVSLVPYSSRLLAMTFDLPGLTIFQ